jgi:ribosome maturation factor RimP
MSLESRQLRDFFLGTTFFMTQIPFEHIEELAAQTAARHGAFLTELVIRGELRSRVLEVYVDTDDGITIDTCSDISRELSEILDQEDLILGAYRLDVSSPDLSRPIHVPRQFKKNIGRVLSVTYLEDGAEQTAEGVLEAADDDRLTLRVNKAVLPAIGIKTIQKAFVVPQMKKRT